MQLLARPFASTKPFDFRAWYEDPMLRDLRGGNQADTDVDTLTLPLPLPLPTGPARSEM